MPSDSVGPTHCDEPVHAETCDMGVDCTPPCPAAEEGPPMIVSDLGLGPWAPGEESRYEPCPRHTGALSRMDFETAVDIAEECDDCRVQHRGITWGTSEDM